MLYCADKPQRRGEGLGQHSHGHQHEGSYSCGKDRPGEPRPALVDRLERNCSTRAHDVMCLLPPAMLGFCPLWPQKKANSRASLRAVSDHTGPVERSKRCLVEQPGRSYSTYAESTHSYRQDSRSRCSSACVVGHINRKEQSTTDLLEKSRRA